MAPRRRNQDEKNLKLLRELATLPCNKQCFDCRQRGPTYINMTIGSFVCTTCSGILRGLNPPHRVKSISMTSFTPEDIDFIKTRGNEYCRKVWFGQSDSHVNVGFESKDEQKIKDFMMQVYDKRQWWVDPSTIAAKTAQIEQLVISPPPGKVPLSALLGKSHTPLHVPNTTPMNNPLPQVNSSIPTSQTSASSEKKLDLLAEFGGDPFGGTGSHTVNNNVGNTENNDNFANFDNNPAFSNSGTNVASPANEPFSPMSNLGLGMSNTNVSAPSNFPTVNMNNDQLGFPAVPSSNVGASFNVQPPAPETTTASSPLASATSTQASDRYAALADLDTMFGTVQTTQSSTWDSDPTSSSSTGWQTTATDISNTTTTTTSTTVMPTEFGGEPNKANPFGGGGGSTQMWNQQPAASQFPGQMWNQQANTAPMPGASWNQQTNPTPGQTPVWNQPPNMIPNQQQMPASSWNQQMPGQTPAVSSWMASSSGQAPVQQSWSQQPMPSQAAFSTGNPFQMGQPVTSNAPVQSGAAFPNQTNSFNTPFNSGQMGSSTATVPSDTNSAFANFNATPSMNSGLAAFPIQNITSPPNGQNQAQFPVQNGGFRTGTSDGWNTDSSSTTWGSATQPPFQVNKTVNNAGIPATSQFANWQQNQGVGPSNPFMSSGVASSQDAPKMNSSNPFL